MEFQRLFEAVAGRVRSDFMKVRPYGSLGDRKCDGLFWGDGTVFQVYSPDALRQAAVVAKIKEDLAGAVAEWGDQLKRWVFVYNTRLGVGPDVPRTLHEQQSKYAHVVIEPLSDVELWELMRETLSIQQRAEILGAPSGYEHLFMPPGAVPEDIENRLRDGHFVVVHDVLAPVNIQDAVEALKPDQPFGPPFYVRPPGHNESWELAAQFQQRIVEDAIRRSRDLLPRFAVFSLSPIPLAIHLGNLLSDRVEVRPFQYDRDRNTWCWDDSQTSYDIDFRVNGLPAKLVQGSVEAVIRVSLSARIAPVDTQAAAGDCPIDIEIAVPKPDVMGLRGVEQLTELGRTFRGVLQDLNRLVPECSRIHLFFAGPTGGAIVVGQAINPRMTPDVLLYEYDRKTEPHYQPALCLR